MKRLISILTAVLILISSAVCVSAHDAVEFEFGEIAHLYIGDVDADTSLSSSDLTALKKVLLSVITPVNNGTADLNFDGTINIIDLIRLKKRLSGQVISSYFNAESDTLKNKIMTAADSLPDTVTGAVYHISETGGDLLSADGSKDKPYSYACLKSDISLSSGDAVLFKRGDTFRGRLTAKNGVYYGAYGEGDKPALYGSAQNYAEAQWTDEGNNVYSLSGFSSDVGIIVFGNDEYVGYKKATKDELVADYDFYYDSENGVLYIYSSVAPAEYGNIEIGVDTEVIRIVGGLSGITVENLCIKYTGGHGISIGDDNADITVKNCEIAYIGGSYLSGSTRYGNGIEFWRGTNNALVENNWIYQIYDSGITHQGGGEYTISNITFRKNLIENCGMGSIEYWMSYQKVKDEETGEEYYLECTGDNVTYADNIMRFAGYGFGGEQRPDKVSAHIRSDVTCPNNITNFNITGNIFDQSAVELIGIGSGIGKYPVMSGNIYAQSTEGKLGTFAKVSDCDFDMFVEYTILNTLKDNQAKLYWY